MLLIYLLLNAASLGLAAVAYKQLSNFLSRHQIIGSYSTLTRFKHLVQFNMYMALVIIGLSGVSLIIGLYLLIQYGLPMLVLIILLNGLLYFLGQKLKVLEVKARNLKCKTSELSEIYHLVCEVWVKKAFPNF